MSEAVEMIQKSMEATRECQAMLRETIGMVDLLIKRRNELLNQVSILETENKVLREQLR